MKNKIEFKVGNIVTVNAYIGREFEAKVFGVDIPILFSENDERVFYDLRGKNIVTKCTGKCIKESKYFEIPTEY